MHWPAWITWFTWFNLWPFLPDVIKPNRSNNGSTNTNSRSKAVKDKVLLGLAGLHFLTEPVKNTLLLYIFQVSIISCCIHFSDDSLLFSLHLNKITLCTFNSSYFCAVVHLIYLQWFGFHTMWLPSKFHFAPVCESQQCKSNNCTVSPFENKDICYTAGNAGVFFMSENVF